MSFESDRFIFPLFSFSPLRCLTFGFSGALLAEETIARATTAAIAHNRIIKRRRKKKERERGG